MIASGARAPASNRDTDDVTDKGLQAKKVKNLISEMQSESRIRTAHHGTYVMCLRSICVKDSVLKMFVKW